MGIEQHVWIANVYGEGQPADAGRFSLVKFVSFEELDAAFSSDKPGYGLGYVNADHSRVNTFPRWDGVYTRILYHMKTGDGRIVTSSHNNSRISSEPRLRDHIFSLGYGDGGLTPISHGDVTVLTQDPPGAKFDDMGGNSYLVIDYSGWDRFDGLGPRHVASWKGVSRKGGCALVDDPSLFRKLPLIEGNNPSGDSSNETEEPTVVADVHPVHIRGGTKTVEHYHQDGQAELYFVGMILRGDEQLDPHVLFSPSHVRPPKEQEIPSFLHVHPSSQDKYFEDWRLRAGDVAYIPAGVVHRAQGEGDKEGGALVGVAAVPWFISHNEFAVKGLH